MDFLFKSNRGDLQKEFLTPDPRLTGLLTNLSHDESTQLFILDFLKQSIASNIGSCGKVIEANLKEGEGFLTPSNKATLIDTLKAQIKTEGNLTNLVSLFEALKPAVDNEAKHLLFSKICQTRQNQPQTKQLWSIFSDIVSKGASPDFYNECKSELRSHIQQLIEKQGKRQDVEQFNRFTAIVQNLAGLGNRQQVLQEVIVIEGNFKKIEENVMPLKVFRDIFLSGGLGFDVTSLFRGGKEG